MSEIKSFNIVERLKSSGSWQTMTSEFEKEDTLSWMAAEKIESLVSALKDCIGYIDVDNLTMQTKMQEWLRIIEMGETIEYWEDYNE